MSNKPQVSSTPESLTDTIVSSTSQDVKSARPVPASRAVNAYGVTVLRGGNVLGSSFVDSVVDAYTNLLSYQPIALLLFLVSLLYYISNILQQDKTNPFLLMHDSIKSLHAEETNKSIKAIASFGRVLSRFLLEYQKFFGLVAAMSFPYLSKPSSRNAILALILTFFCLFSKADPISILALSQLFFLLVQLRSPKHKTLVIIIAVVTVIVSQETFAAMADAK